MSDREAVDQLRFTQWNGRERSLKFEPQSFYLPVEELSESSKGGVHSSTSLQKNIPAKK